MPRKTAPVQVLCLHGMGDNSEIFRAQTAAFRALLPLNYKFTFLDGDDYCDPLPGVADVYPGPYRCWYRTPTAAKVAAAHQRVLSYVGRRDGGIDVVMGFSQGASLAASLILHHQLEHPHPHPPLFHSAIFFSAPLPFSHSPKHGIDTRRYFGINVPQLGRSGSRPDTVPPHLIPDAAYLRRDSDDHTSSHQATTTTASPIYQMFHPSADPIRIAIPTAHIYGREGDDAWRAHAMDLVTLCREEGRMVLNHEGGHEIPRGSGVNEDVCDVFEAVVAVAKAGSGAGVSGVGLKREDTT